MAETKTTDPYRTYLREDQIPTAWSKLKRDGYMEAVAVKQSDGCGGVGQRGEKDARPWPHVLLAWRTLCQRT
ncbi:hypothetical protein HF885_06740 [Olsenella umbonata]|uniref:Uncharacterized protein n=1 Tax=Parafannyhessea umbonata TaxID=604330 RepID=A0A7X9TAX9_9ACTN|nr:hypothetical protein [Parafannyhessea umbonata]NMF26123.1 hypothetical protein [Parafannyhessea umbonata]